jgi:hypothetical protein
MAKAARSSLPPERDSADPSTEPKSDPQISPRAKGTSDESHAMLLARRALELAEEVPTPGRTSTVPSEEHDDSSALPDTGGEGGLLDDEELAAERSSDFGSFLANLSRPSETTAFRVHDRTHLEFAIDYRLREDKRIEKFEWEAYFFAPESLRLDSRTYSKEDVYEDLQTYVRFAVPECTYHELADVPLERVRTALASNDAELSIRELRLFACQVRASGAEAKQHIVEGLVAGGDRARFTAAAHRMIADTGIISAKLRAVLALAVGRPDPLQTAVLWIDEDVSRLFETLMASLAIGMRECEAGSTEAGKSVIAAAEAAAVSQARYRDKAGLEGIGRIGMKSRRIEQIEFRRHVLKRFTSSVLWLSPEVSPAATWVLHVLNALAAAVAMAFAVVAAIWNGADTSGNITRWAVVAIIAYALKDRIKALLQASFAGVVSRNFADRSWRIRDRERKIELGEMEEQSGFLAFQEVPKEVLAVRRTTRRHVLEEQARPETVLFHRKEVVLNRDRIAAADPRFDALTEILRLDMRRWLVNTDDPKRSFVFADPDAGVIGAAMAPRVYNIAVVYRLRREGEPGAWHRVRVVVSRKGIRRVEAIS